VATPWLAAEKATDFFPFLLMIIAGALLGLWITPIIQSVNRPVTRVALRVAILLLGFLLFTNIKVIYQVVPGGLAGSSVLFLNMTAIPFMSLCAIALLTDVLNLPGMMRKPKKKP